MIALDKVGEDCHGHNHTKHSTAPSAQNAVIVSIAEKMARKFEAVSSEHLYIFIGTMLFIYPDDFSEMIFCFLHNLKYQMGMIRHDDILMRFHLREIIGD